MKVYLFRHSMTNANIRKAYIGATDESLSNEGIKLINDMRGLGYPNPEIIISSPMRRCIETIENIYPNSKIDFIADGLKEINFGVFENKTYEELKNDPQYQMWVDNYQTFEIPSGESFRDFNERVYESFKKIVETYKDNKEILIMCHGGVIRSILSKIGGKAFFEWEVPFASGYELTINANNILIEKYEGNL